MFQTYDRIGDPSNAFAYYLLDRLDDADEWDSNPDHGGLVALFKNRVLYVDTQGFAWLQHFESADIAETHYEEAVTQIV